MTVDAPRPLKLLRRSATPWPVPFFRPLRTRGNAISVTSAPSAARTKSGGRHGNRREIWSGFWLCEHCRDRTSGCRGTTSNPRGVRRDFLCRGGSWDREDHRPRGPDRQPDPRWGRSARSHRRSHLYRKSGRRNEASSPQRDRDGKVESDARGTRSNSTERSRNWSSLVSARSTPFREISSMSGRSRRGSIRSSKSLRKRKLKSSPIRLSRIGFRQFLPIHPRACVVS